MVALHIGEFCQIYVDNAKYFLILTVNNQKPASKHLPKRDP